jgi:exopolysaccharide biosynthesis polyprenyl glycosylphosphotransferase
MLRQFSARRITISFIIDWLGTLGTMLLAVYFRVRIGFLPDQFLDLLDRLHIPVMNWWEGMRPEQIFAFPVLVLISLIWPFFFIVFNVYDGRKNDTHKAELLNVLMAVIASNLTLAGILFLTYRLTSRGLFIIFFILNLSFLLSWRIVWFVFRSSKNGKPRFSRNVVLVVGAGKVGQRVSSEIDKYAYENIHIVGYVDDDLEKQGELINELPVLGTLDQVMDIVREYSINVALIALPLSAHHQLINVSQTLQKAGVRVNIIPDLFSLSFPSATLDGFGGIPVIDLGQPGIQGFQRIIKRIFDILAVTFGLIILSPIFALIAVCIKIDSPGPVLYKQKRLGENGQIFTMYKFRSMVKDTDSNIHRNHVTRLIQENIGPEMLNENSGSTIKLDKDPRITRIGNTIRKASLDELPQLINVLRGDMSLVGPRPPLPYEVELYNEWHMKRFEAPPGITGLWQVKARNQVSFDEMVRLDMQYIENYSMWLDISIILQTPIAMIRAKGAG